MKSRSLTFATQMLFSSSGLDFSTHPRILFSSEYFHYKIFIHEKCLENQNDKFQENFSRPGIIDARARRLRNTALYNTCKCRLMTRTVMTLTVWAFFFRLTLWSKPQVPVIAERTFQHDCTEIQRLLFRNY